MSSAKIGVEMTVEEAEAAIQEFEALGIRFSYERGRAVFIKLTQDQKLEEEGSKE